MSFDVHLSTVHLSDKLKESTNPFTNEKTMVPDGEKITDSERQQILEFFKSVDCSEPDDFSIYPPV